MNHGTPKKILVVDDEASIIELIRQILTEHGYEVYAAKDGREGLRQFEQIHPDLVLTDIVMPDIEGIEFIRTLVMKKKELPIIVISGDEVGINFFKAACLLGARKYLTKPFTDKELIETVDSVLMY